MYLANFFKKYIKDTPKESIVADKKTYICGLTKTVLYQIKNHFNENNLSKKVSISTKCLKHLYDGKPAEEFFFLINNLHKVIKYPEKIYKNLDGKKGDFCFVKNINGDDYMCSIEC